MGQLPCVRAMEIVRSGRAIILNIFINLVDEVIILFHTSPVPGLFCIITQEWSVFRGEILAQIFLKV